MRRSRIAHLDGKMKFIERAYTNTADGYDTTVDEVVSEVWASVTPTSAEEITEASRLDEQYTHTIAVRYDETMRAITGVNHHATLGDRTFELVGPPIDVNERHVELQFKARERPTVS